MVRGGAHINDEPLLVAAPDIHDPALFPESTLAQGVPEEGANGIAIEGKESDAESQAMRQVETPAELASFGLAENDPVALVTAA
jgi:hypothetical protein